MGYRFHSPRKKSLLCRYGLTTALATLGAAVASFGFLIPATSGMGTPPRVFTEGLNVKLERTSPAFAALEDAWMGALPAETSFFPKTVSARAIRDVKIELLPPGSKENVISAAGLLAERIVSDNHRERVAMARERESRAAMSRFLAEAAAQALRKISAHLEVPIEPIVDQAESATQRNPTQTISLTELKMSREELIGSLIFPIATSVPVSIQPERAAASRLPALVDRNAKAGWVGGNALLPRVPRDPHAESVQPVTRQVLVSGPIELTDGMALANASDKVIVFRDLDGEPQESGAVWLREGRYELFAEENVGFIVGELRTPYGDVIGRGMFDLAHQRMSAGNQRRIENAVLKIRPVNQGMNGRVVGVRSEGTRSGIKSAQIQFHDLPLGHATKAEGRFAEPTLLEGSSAIIKASRTGYWGTMMFGHAGDDNEIEIFPNQEGQMIHGLVALSRPTGVTSDSASIIWGRVSGGGKPLAGARVELMTTTEIVQPVYFNSALIPDPSLSETSANGLYAFFPVPPGAHAVQAVLKDSSATEPYVFPTEVRTVSRVDIETSTERRAKAKVFDALKTDMPLAAEIMNPGLARGVVIDRLGQGELRYSSGRGLLILDADAGPNYERIRISMNRDRRLIYFPMIQSAWLEGMRSSSRLNKEPQTGTVVGFVQGVLPYRIALEEKSVLATSRVEYFNSKGERTGQSFGEPGGGFIIFNVPEGFRTVTVQPSGSTKIYSSVALVEGRVTNVISHSIR